MEAKHARRGRPKKLDREQVLRTAVMQYWEKGVEVSISDICAIIDSSKPSVYREFGSDDGLKSNALEAYQHMAIDPFLALFDPAKPLAQTKSDIVEFVIQDRAVLGVPSGCLFVAMRAQRDKLGPKTLAQLDQVRLHFLDSFATWINALKDIGVVRRLVPTQIAAYHLDALHSGAMRMQRENVSNEEIGSFLNFGFTQMLKA